MRLTINVLHYGCLFSTLQCLNALYNDIVSRPCSVSAIIVPSNGTGDDNDSIFKWAKEHFELCYDVDNDCSFASSKKKVRDSLEFFNGTSFILIRNNANKGFAAGHNPGIALALKLAADAVWLLNNDSVIQSDAIKELEAAYITSNGNKILGTTVVESDNPTVLQCAGGMTFNPYLTCIAVPLREQPVNKVGQLATPAFDYVYGASMFVPTKIFREVGLLSEDYFLFYEEMDLCQRAKAAGYKLDWCRNAVVLHRSEGQKSEGAVRVFHDTRSFTIFARRYYSKAWAVMACVHGIGRCCSQLIQGQFGNAGAALRGLYYGFSFLIKLKLAS